MKEAVADRDRTALYLYLVQRNTLAEVVALEDRAQETLQRRKAHRDALGELLTREGTIEGKPIDKALGKVAVDEASQTNPTE